MTTLSTPLPTTHARLSVDVCLEVAHLLAETLRAEPPQFRQFAMPSDRSNLPLGGYLLGYGYAKPHQVVRALRTQEQALPGETRMLIGEILVHHDVISPRVLATMLAIQLVDRLIDPQPFQPNRIGEHLVSRGLIQPRQLAGALQLQTWLRRKGMPIQLGELLVHQGLVGKHHLAEVLNHAKSA
ncbi:MAG: hypothetical protein AB4911_01245 [Oscillochloridaceae bacterium umkhey_bin13]